MRKVKSISSLCMLITFLLVKMAQAKEIYVETDMSPVGKYRPLENLVVALKRHPKSKLFRVVWWTSGSSGMYTNTVALYDRKRRTLKYSAIYHFVVRDNEDSFYYKKESETVLYSNVSDGMIYSLNRDEKLWENDSAIEGLVRLGSKKLHLSYIAYFEKYEGTKLVRVKVLPPQE